MKSPVKKEVSSSLCELTSRPVVAQEPEVETPVWSKRLVRDIATIGALVFISLTFSVQIPEVGSLRFEAKFDANPTVLVMLMLLRKRRLV